MLHGSCYILKKKVGGRAGHWRKLPSVVLAWERGIAVTVGRNEALPRSFSPVESCSTNLKQLREIRKHCHLHVIGGDPLWPKEGLRETPSWGIAVKTSRAQFIRGTFCWWRAGNSHTRHVKMTRQRVGGTEGSGSLQKPHPRPSNMEST